MLSRGDLAAGYSCLVGECREGRATLSWEVNGDRQEGQDTEHRKCQLHAREKSVPWEGGQAFEQGPRVVLGSPFLDVIKT